MRRIDLTNVVFGRLVAIERDGIRWRCRCECGGFVNVRLTDLRRGSTKSCGCLRSENTTAMRTTHGLYHHPVRMVWKNMVARCTDPDHIEYRRYGARGISVCDAWKSLKSFHEWAIAAGWKKGLQIDRIDNGGNYEPGNCRIVDCVTNANNRRNNHHLTAFGETKTVAQWSRDHRCAVSQSTLAMRIWRGTPHVEAISTPTTPTTY